MIRTFALALAGASVLLSAPALADGPASGPVTEAEIRAHIEELASDRYGGRRPGTEGETLTAHYMATRLAAAGFQPGGEGPMGWYAPVPLIELSPVSSSLEARLANGEAVRFGEEFALRAPRGSATISNGEAVFVGFGLGADGSVPEGVRGHIVIMLASERNAAQPQGLRTRRDALIRAGAAAVLVISDIEAPFSQFLRSYASGAIQLAEPLLQTQLDGLMSRDFGTRLLAAGGISAGELARFREKGEAFAEPLTLRLNLSAMSRARAYNSYNVVARLPGRRAGSGAVLLTGHWDHLGSECRPEGAEDRICNGAVDNASGMAVLIETARRLTAGPRLDRDVYIVATTAEESGLLGATWFVANPPMPVAQMHAVLNIDTVAIAPRGAAVAIVGRGTTDFDDDVEAVAAQLGRPMLTGEAADAPNAFIRRQDGWAFTQAGVPAIMAGGSFADAALLQAYLSGPYHKPDDELTDAVPLGGAADDADLHVALTRRLATVRLSPARTMLTTP
jgi:hypothetical protein